MSSPLWCALAKSLICPLFKSSLIIASLKRCWLGTLKICPPVIFLSNWLAPSLANPAKAERPTVLPIVGATFLNTGRRLLKLPLPVCFLTFALVIFICTPLPNSRLLATLLTVFLGTIKVSLPDKSLCANLIETSSYTVVSKTVTLMIVIIIPAEILHLIVIFLLVKILSLRGHLP